MSSSVMSLISINDLYPHPDNPRKDIGDITELTKSIKTAGMIYQNLTVMPGHYEKGELVEGGYTIIMGHRRCAAAKAAGLKELPCKIIEGIDKKEQIAMMLEENMQRNDLTIFEQADSFQMMLDLGESMDTLVKKTGFSKQTVKHRVEIAKLDKDLLKDKSEDEYFQMSLKDIYELEKIEDVETRNRILKEATSSYQIEWKVKQAVEEAESEKKMKEVVKIFKEMGIKKAPKEAQKELWSGKWDLVKNLGLDEVLKKKFSLKKSKDPYYWLKAYSEIKLIKIHKKTAKETKAEEEKKNLEKRKRDLNRLKKSISESIKEFLIELMKKKTNPVKVKEEELISRIWNLITNNSYTAVTVKSIIGYLENKESWQVKEEDINNWNLAEVSTAKQMIVSLSAAVTKNRELVDYCGCYMKENAEKYRELIELLFEYGFSLKADEARVITGEHELYIKEGEEE